MGPDATDAEGFARRRRKWDLAEAADGESVDLGEFAVDRLGEGEGIEALPEGLERHEPLPIDPL